MDGPRRLRWGILGTGKIARIFGASLARSRTGVLAAVASRTGPRAHRFATDLDVTRWYGDYAGLLADPAVDVVYVATPHPSHGELVERAAAAGKHVLCEKPLTVTAEEARRCVAAAARHGVFLMEGFAYRCHPQTRRLLRMLEAGDIGEPRILAAVFGYDAGPDPGNYLFRRDLAGGSILDVGCYAISMARLVAGVATQRPYAEPRSITGAAHVCAEHGVDHRAVASLEFDGGLLAQVSCAVDAALGSGLRLVGSDGEIVLADPWLPGRGCPPTMTLRTRAGERVLTADPDDPDLYAAEADEAARCIDLMESPAMRTGDSLGNMEALDRWRAAVELVFPQDLAASDDEG